MKIGEGFSQSHGFFLSGPGELGCRPDGAGFVGVGAQILFMRVGVSCMFFGQDRFLDRLVGRVRQRVVERMMAGILEVAFPVHAGPLLGSRSVLHRTFGEWLSR